MPIPYNDGTPLADSDFYPFAMPQFCTGLNIGMFDGTEIAWVLRPRRLLGLLRLNARPCLNIVTMANNEQGIVGKREKRMIFSLVV